jgi:putative ABC transport system ATP-binding protein
MDTVIDAHNVSKIYNAETIPVYAVNEVHLHLEQGEFTALVGPSGSGKTTLLNLIGGLDRPDSGNIYIQGLDIIKLSANKLIDFRLRNIGFVFQSFNLIPVLTAKENVEFIMLLQGIKKRDRDARV